MPTFIDESGDTGVYPLGGSHFRLAAVWMSDADIEPFRAEIGVLRKRLGLQANYEFKFVKSGGHENRVEGFFEAASAFGFRFAFASLDKRVEPWPTATASEIHYAVVTHLAALLRPHYLQLHRVSGQQSLQEKVFLDDCQDQSFLAIVKEKFRELGKSETPPLHLIGKVRFRGSKPDELIQLADMVCGACGAAEEGHHWARSLIANHALR